MPTVSTQTEIAAPPEKVRATFLDFSSYPEWSHAFVKSLTPSDGKDPAALKAGDSMKVELTGMTFSPKVTSNTAERFSWVGSLPFIFTGEHSFNFQRNAAGNTTLLQEEAFTGLLSFLMGESWSFGKDTKKNFEAFNHDLKARAETEQAAGDLNKDLEARAQAFRGHK